MESRFKIAGHAVHPMLIVLPLGLLPISVVFDIIWYVTDDLQYAPIGFFLVAAGVIGAVLAALTGTVDAFSIPNGTRAKRIVLFHGGGNLIVAALFATSWALRLDTAFHRPTSASLTLAIIGTVLGVVTGWLGGELVQRLGVGVDDAAQLDATSSLRRTPIAAIDLRDRPTAAATPPVVDRDREHLPR